MSKFGIVLGEPNSINSEILAKSNVYKKKAIIRNDKLLNKQKEMFLKIKILGVTEFLAKKIK